MNEYTLRTHNAPLFKDIAKNVPEKQTIIVFNTQKQYDLWENEFSGQISDGKWENSRRTEWIWQAPAYLDPDVDKPVVYVLWMSNVGTKHYNWDKDFDEIGLTERMRIECGMDSDDEVKKTWKEIAIAIANPVMMSSEMSTMIRNLQEEKRLKDENTRRENREYNEMTYIIPLLKSENIPFSKSRYGHNYEIESKWFEYEHYMSCDIYGSDQVKGKLFVKCSEFSNSSYIKGEDLIKYLKFIKDFIKTRETFKY